MAARKPAGRVFAFGAILDAPDQMIHRPVERGGGRGPQAEQPRACGAGGIRSGVGIGAEREPPIVAQDLKRGELPDELGVDVGALDRARYRSGQLACLP